MSDQADKSENTEKMLGGYTEKMLDGEHYVVVLLHDPDAVDPVSHTRSGGGALLSRPMTLADASAHAQGCRNSQPSFQGKFHVCRIVASV